MKALFWLPHLRRFLGVFSFLLIGLGSSSAWALTCQTSSGATQFTEPIGNVSVPDTVPDGTIIWISPTRTTSGTCKKSASDSVNLATVDHIYFYSLQGSPRAIYPGDPSTWGIDISIRYNGAEYPLSEISGVAGNGLFTGFTLPPCSLADYNRGVCFINVSITYQIVIRKHGLSPFVHPTQDLFSLFQFDGQLGINSTQASYQYILSGMSNIVGTACTVDVKVTPEPGVVDFGEVQAVPGGFSPSRPTKPFNLALDKSCSTSIKVSGYFETSNAVQNNLLLPAADSNFGISIQNQNGVQVPIREPFLLGTFSPTQTQMDVPMTASLVPLGTPKIGPFSATATILILYD
ncbi:fimbrial protein [Variovorax sp. YR216]|uniref:fimbrial protein n=1 Tax=Variovorax sp. YR216 TaxID=1882828 RepID=UPI00089D1C0B|nr:fimbrial protein [Variovorax sp. YR216]SEA03305.1 major type 1 subunit fimbrin (pilin) [Variovorax sp. YR216]